MSKIDKKYYLALGGLILLIIIGAVFLFLRPSKTEKSQVEESSVFEEPVEDIPVLDKSVEINIKGKTDAVISVSNVPKGTKNITYELSYNTKAGSIEGVRGMMDVEGVKATEDITFGTCSSGVCRYHEIDGVVSGVFIFSGDYGEKMREQDFDL
jgi:hypothetical protein